MKIDKLKIKKENLDLNLKFYFMLKNLVKSKQSASIVSNLIMISSHEEILKLEEYLNNSVKNNEKRNFLLQITETLLEKIDFKLFQFSLRLYLIKDLLLQEAKIAQYNNQKNLSRLNPLSLEYDKISVYTPYTTRVNGALLSLIFFDNLEAGKVNFMSQDAIDFIKDLSRDAKALKLKGLEPNQIFMLMFSESINQSIISESGSNYEDRIQSVFIEIGIPEKDIRKIHDENDASTEYDFFFKLGKHSFGVGAKRTLRERYKQFLKTSRVSQVDIMIQITLGLDLNESKAKTITENGVILFVSDEIYQSRPYLKRMCGVYSVCDLSLKTLNKIAQHKK